MPVYDFVCRECGGVSEIFLRHAGQVPSCSYCGSDELNRKFSGSYFIKSGAQRAGNTCCGREERCEAPPCSNEGCQCH